MEQQQQFISKMIFVALSTLYVVSSADQTQELIKPLQPEMIDCTSFYEATAAVGCCALYLSFNKFVR